MKRTIALTEVDSQTSLLTPRQVGELLGVMNSNIDGVKGGHNAVIDWTNRTIRVLSASKPLIRKGKMVVLSGGPAFAQDIVIELS